MRYSNEFYFVTPATLVSLTEIPRPRAALLSWRRAGRHRGMEGPHRPTLRLFQLRSRDPGVSHDHRARTVARYSRPNVAARCRNDAEPAPSILGAAAFGAGSGATPTALTAICRAMIFSGPERFQNEGESLRAPQIPLQAIDEAHYFGGAQSSLRMHDEPYFNLAAHGCAQYILTYDQFGFQPACTALPVPQRRHSCPICWRVRPSAS